eukprot:TRINITY_DN66947_c0_g1_i1.p1 TRINITY_DN66947_c0_g1~~TRINITY_DN66947_c0_g1_i1.p1  ORF type:complete len:621 (+),score=56.04 TRINITY_DN66947_c0_g1_i1:103-1965(+)
MAATASLVAFIRGYEVTVQTVVLMTLALGLLVHIVVQRLCRKKHHANDTGQTSRAGDCHKTEESHVASSKKGSKKNKNKMSEDIAARKGATGDPKSAADVSNVLATGLANVQQPPAKFTGSVEVLQEPSTAEQEVDTPHDSEIECWEYMDHQNVIRGPFSGAKMFAWFELQMLPLDLQVRHDASMPFLSVGTIFHPPLIPFRTRPRLSQAQIQSEASCLHDSVAWKRSCWEYVDPTAIKRGPFGGADMLFWYENQMLPESLPVRHDSSMKFVPIRELFHPPLLPFRSCALRREIESIEQPSQNESPKWWEYVDNQGVIQGPFAELDMVVWFENHMLPADLRIRHAYSMPFVPLMELFHPPLIPFRSQPSLLDVQVTTEADGDEPSCAIEEADDLEEADEEDEDVEDSSVQTRTWKDQKNRPELKEPEAVANMRISPLDVRFSQLRARCSFRDGRFLHETIPQIEAVKFESDPGTDCWLLKAPFPPIQILETRCKVRDSSGRPKLDPVTGRQIYDREGHFFTLDNRRLYCLQRVAMTLWPAQVVVDVMQLPPGAPSGSRHLRKFRTLDSGCSILINDKFGTVEPVHWSWREVAGLRGKEPGNSEDRLAEDYKLRRRGRAQY